MESSASNPMRMNCTRTIARKTASSRSGLLCAYGYGGKSFWMMTMAAKTNASAHKPKAAKPKKEKGLVEELPSSVTLVRARRTREGRAHEYFGRPDALCR